MVGILPHAIYIAGNYTCRFSNTSSPRTDLFSFRPESTLLNNEDVDYLAKGFMALPREDTVTLPEDDMSLFRRKLLNIVYNFLLCCSG